ncbi:hypothetical protein [Segniliparus rotundus]|uniref:hypothetical protein n=1 Tax=Segniliparus rotundus TaxID=286802 RepID=UPI0016516D50|nr:hypothetical protein [Segniliparus rotundus]
MATEVKVLRKASAYFTRENVPLKGVPAGREPARRQFSRRGGLPGSWASPAWGMTSSSAVLPPPREVAGEALGSTIREVWSGSRDAYGVRRVRAKPRLGLGVRVAHSAPPGSCARRGSPGPAPATRPDLVKRQFRAEEPNRRWVTDITQRPAAEGWVRCTAVPGVFSRKVVGWSIADHIKAE